ncbi:MAG: C40 family peptidase, partial [Candidatus Limnocylindria bacterium]
DRDSAVLARLPAGTPLPEDRHLRRDGGDARGIPARKIGRWHPLGVADPARPGRLRAAFVALEETVAVMDLPHRPPTADDLLRTAEAYLGGPYLWGGTSVGGIDCSGLVQQVYRLNGVGLDRDADQQALEGRPVERAMAGDLLFFGLERVTHVALAAGPRELIHAPLSGHAVERATLSPERAPRSIRRYLPEPA